MRKPVVSTLVAMMLSGMLGAAQAADGSGGTPFFFGPKGGFMDLGVDNSDPAINIAGVIGAPIQRYFSWEAELSLTLSDGDIGRNNRDWDITTLAGYGVFRTEGKVGFKGKLGLAYWDADNVFSENEDDIDLSAGVGVGIRLGRSGMLDIEFTEINEFTDFISVGYLFNYR